MTDQHEPSENAYWKSPADARGEQEPPPPPGVSRRGFLEAAGFTITAATVAGCHRAPEQHALPFAVQPENARPGRMQQFASTCFGCPAACGLLVSVRDGRPLKMEGMPEHPLSRGGLCAVGQAQPMALYDSHRLTGPVQQSKSEPPEWSDVDKQIVAKLASIKQDGGAVRVVTPTINSPTLLKAIDQFLEPFSDAQHVVFDSNSASAILDAHEKTHGQRVLPRYAFDQARVIVSFEADFLGNWISPVEHTTAWRKGRTLPHRATKRAHDEHAHHASTGKESSTLEGHAEGVTSVAFSPDGRRIVSASGDKTIKVWDASTGEETLTLEGHAEGVTSVAFSPDGRRIVSASGDKTIKVWDASTGEETLTLEGHAEGVTSVAFSPDGRRIVSASGDKTIKVWDASTGEETLTLEGHAEGVTSVAFSPDGRRIVSASGDKTIKVWDASTGEETLTLEGHAEGVTSVAFSPDGRRIVSASGDKTIKVWDASTGEETLTLEGHAEGVTSVAFSPDGRRIVSASGDKTIKVWDASTGEETLTLEGHAEGVTSVAFSPDGRRIVSASGDKTIKVWEPAEMSYHVQLEGRMTLTGSNADQRIRLHPGEVELVLGHLHSRLASLAGKETGNDEDLPKSAISKQLDDLAQRLWQHKGESIVVCGHNNVAAQMLVNHLNELLGNYGQTLEVTQPSKQRLSNDADVAQLAADLGDGKIAGLIVAGIDLTYYLPALADSIEKTQLSISLASHQTDDFASRAQFICPDHHFLESWLDAEPIAGLYSICQPTIDPLGDTRSAIESFSIWSAAKSSTLDALKEYWQENVFPLQQDETDFTQFWDRAVHDGVVEVDSPALDVAFKPAQTPTPSKGASEKLALVLHPSLTIPDARHAQNPWLQELPDPITKVTWDNYLAVSPRLAQEQGLADNDVVQLNVGDSDSVALPVFIQPGQHDQVVSVSLGYGAPGTERFKTVGPQWLEAGPTLGANGLVGSSVSHLLKLSDGESGYVQGGVELKKTGRQHVLATTQMHDSIETPLSVTPPGSHGRQALVQETTLAKFNDNPVTAGAPHLHHFDGQLWPDDHPYEGHRWGMSIDLTACTGCSACLIACQSENNVPVVGRDEVRRHREMHWIRIDRYYSGGEEEPKVVHQPMMCQHCANAPCETVCPVLATVHSSEGLNQQVYNRCVGTRYCANNCPYKVRRFNWFNYAHDDTLQNLALNPDVTVRMRGIMEKCSMCVQRIQEGKIESRRLGQDKLSDGAIQTACQQTCPAGAIVFGDLNDLGDPKSDPATPPSRVAQQMGDARSFHVLEELNVQPGVAYLRKVRNNSQEEHGV